MDLMKKPVVRDLLGDHIYATYLYLRLGMAALALAFPLLLWLLGVGLHLPLQGSMSAYYHTELRDAFVGILVAIGAFLFLYKGFSRREDWALNASGVLAIGIAVFPMDPAALFRCKPLCGTDCMPFTNALDRTTQWLIDTGAHGVCAIAFFVPIFFVCAVFSRETVKTLPHSQRLFMTIYGVLGAAMVVLPLLILAMRQFGWFGKDVCTDRTIFWVEAVLVWSFALFWIAKTVEIRINRADRRYPNRREKNKEVAPAAAIEPEAP